MGKSYKNFGFILAASVVLISCAHREKTFPPRTQPPVIIPDDQCPRADGQPCK